ncbi:E3 ubiquitin-protein ligase TRIM35-like [Garra rufa]|uniref:E3 ubiquitin-protein ligase TRIM35-like n=1 Tax=Garra rufa TaxID=137080 RepID=UPI003CCEBE2D
MALDDELSCPVCTEFFNDPVLLSCGHSFCRQCINDNLSLSIFRKCPVCQQASPQPPVPNLSLRDTCEAYLREQNTRRESSGGQECEIHGEVIKLFCQTDGKAICAKCKRHEHERHKTQPLQQAIRQRKGNLKADLRPAEKTLWSLQNGAAQHNKISKFIQYQSQMTERSIRMEFQKIHQFLKKEEESRIVALHEEEKEKGEKMEKSIREGILSLSGRVREVEEQIEDDDITFLKNYPRILNRAKYTLPDVELSSQTLIDVPKHLGNMKYQVWEKMKDICPFYPVILNPNTSLPDFSVSDDLASVTSCSRRPDEPNAFPQHRSRMVLGTVGYWNGVHTWDIEVGNSRHWSLGVCLGRSRIPITQSLTPANGFWGLRRDGDSYRLIDFRMSKVKMRGNPELVRVKLECGRDRRGMGQWLVRFFDARSDKFIAYIDEVPGSELFPFVIPKDQSASLRIVPADIILTVDKKLGFFDRHITVILICLCVFMIIFMILVWAIQRCKTCTSG